MVAEHDRTAPSSPTPAHAGEGSGMTVECAVYRVRNIYRAVCLDLGLIVERPSADGAMQELMDLIRMYVHDARDAGLSPNEMLRPVPRSERRYVYRKVITALVHELLLSIVRGPTQPSRGPRRIRAEYLSCSV